MSVAVERLLEQASQLNPRAQRELLARLAERVGVSEEDLWRLRLAESEYQRWEDPRDEAVIKRFPSDKQKRMDDLAERYNEGELDAQEEAEYLQLVDEVRRLTVENVRALARRRHPEMFEEFGELKRSPGKRQIHPKRRGRRRGHS